MIKVGITGGIGSGKTVFCKIWEDLGAYVLYADNFARELMQSHAGLKLSIKNAFGEEAYHENGCLNREYLSREAFQKNRVEILNRIVHPVLWQETDKLSKKKEEEGVEVFAYEAAILLNKGRPDRLDYVVLILADEEERLNRAAKRDQMDRDEVSDRIKNQPDFEKFTDHCDFVVMNNGSLEELELKAKQIFNTVRTFSS